MLKSTCEWVDYDRYHICHPFPPMPKHFGPLPVREAHGVRLTLENGIELIDGISSWWTAIHGYNHPSLNKAIESQLNCMSHIMFGGLTHKPAAELAKRLVEITAPSLDIVFFSESGSAANEVALKLAIQYWEAIEQPNKKKFISFKHGYHGDTFGAMSVSDPDLGMHIKYSLGGVQRIHAHAPESKPDRPFLINSLDNVRALLECHSNEVAALIIEPIVQGIGGMRFHHPKYIAGLRSLCDQFNILLILDEVATGFGRTGTLFAYEQAKITPDILCLGKALTGGYLSLAAQ